MERAFKIVVKGLVQGIGFRPYVFNLATFYALKGWVKNTSRGVEIWIEGKERLLKSFLEELPKKVPPPGSITELQFEEVNIQHYKNFEIIKGEGEEGIELDLLPDLALCSFCKEELKDPENRRFEYPFIACTSCGPRFSVIEVLPYERENTTMRHFPLCKECDREYKDPTNRRFHAEAIACNRCGPQVVLVDPRGNLLAEKREALTLAQQFLREGKILALKGLTGFHLIARADREDIIETLRKRKKRPSKPFAIMVKDLEAAEKFVYLTKRDKELLTSPSAPILILKGKGNLPFNLTDGINLIGIFLPYSPLHYLLLKDLNFPIICTSGNFSGEPLLFENEEAMGKLSKIAHYFLLHNRPIKRPLDDSVLKKADDFYIMIRRSRGYTPLPQRIPFEIEKPLLAVGGNEKNTFALAFKNKIIVSHHIGDLDNPETFSYFEKSLEDYLNLYKIEPEIVVADLHPFYSSTEWARRFTLIKGISLKYVQHHLAHLYSVLAEEPFVEGKVLGVIWDGTGYGLDNSIWGGEFFLVEDIEYKRVFTFRPFKLIGGEKAIKDTRRMALSLLFEIYNEKTFNLPLPFLKTFSERELILLYKAWERGLNSPTCSSVGRLFDALSAILQVCYFNSYSGEAGLRIESLYLNNIEKHYPYNILNDFYIDWEPIILSIIDSLLKDRESIEIIATKFINTLVEIVAHVVEKLNIYQICISGGVMMNAPLVNKLFTKLSKKGVKVFRNKNYPPNDGGISLGQAYYIALSLEK